MTEKKYLRASILAKKATAITRSLETMDFAAPSEIQLFMAEKKSKESSGRVQIHCEDSGNPNDIIMRITALLREHLTEIRAELEAEFKAL